MQPPTFETRSFKEQEQDAQKITCPTCYAPVGEGCVSITWEAGYGVYVPYLEGRNFHPKRLKRWDKYRGDNA